MEKISILESEATFENVQNMLAEQKKILGEEANLKGLDMRMIEQLVSQK
jgi:hypothetical protein